MPSSSSPSGSPPHRRASLDDVAQAAGVGKSTAARALKGDKHVARKTQRVVMEAAQKLGYQPDPILSTLARERWRSREGYNGVAVAFVHYPGPDGDDPDLLEQLEGMQEVAVPRGYKIDVINASELPHVQRLEEILVTRNYRGLALGAMHCSEAWLQLDLSRFCLVSLAEHGVRVPVDSVGQDHFTRTQLALRHILQAGYRRPGLALLSGRAEQIREDALAAIQFAGMQQGISFCPAYRGDAGAARPFLNWLADNQPDVVLADTPVVYGWLEQAGLSGPGGTGMACLFLTRHNPDIAGLRPEADQVGRRAMELLDHHICTNTRGFPSNPARLLISPAWQDGPSLPPRT